MTLTAKFQEGSNEEEEGRLSVEGNGSERGSEGGWLDPLISATRIDGEEEEEFGRTAED